MKAHFLFLLLLVISFNSCSDGKEGLKEQTLIQTSEQIRAQNENQRRWAAKLEKDLKNRRDFIDAIEGEFEGSFLLRNSSFKVRVIFSPSIPNSEINRERTLAELEFELQNLGLNIHVIQWNPHTDLSGVSCIIEGVKPNVARGLIDLITENCKQNTYKFFLAEDGFDEEISIETEGRNVANLIKNGSLKYVQSLKGKLRSNSKVYSLTLERM